MEVEPNGEGFVIGVVTSRFNETVVDGLLEGCVEELLGLGVRTEDITLVSVPGALEIPWALRRLAETGRFDALVALGAVIRGETYHFEIVAGRSAAGIQQVQLESGIPIANGVLTTDTDEQAQARLDKGAEAARVALEMANLAQAIEDD
ncbi:MAG: 6,7-dimethyl-8-ribityllumazine synthase [Betaproteobacteria bacterium]